MDKPILSEGQSLRIRAFVTLGMGLGTVEQRARARAAQHINKAAAILDKLDRAREKQDG
jgi:hypothetical protein